MNSAPLSFVDEKQCLFHHVVLASFPDVPVRALGLKALQELIFLSVQHLCRLTDLSVLAPDLILGFTLWDLDSECTGVPIISS